MTVCLRRDIKEKTECQPLKRVPSYYLKEKNTVDGRPARKSTGEGLPVAATLSAGFRQGCKSADALRVRQACLLQRR